MTPAKPYESVSLTAHGCCCEQAKAVPPLQPVPASMLIGFSSAEQDPTGLFTDALPFHPHDGLQQSQYRVVSASPL
jgi:hypothetical protein